MDNYNRLREEFEKEMEKQLKGKLENLPFKIKYRKDIADFERNLTKVLKKVLER